MSLQVSLSIVLLELATLACSASPQPASPLCGHVVDASAKRVPGASIKLFSEDSTTQLTTESDASGRFCFSALPQAKYFIEAHTAFLVTASPQPFTLTAQSETLPDLFLAVAPVSSQITVTGTGFPQSPAETSKQLDVVDAAESNRIGNNSLVQAVRDLPGLRVSQRGGPGSFSSIQIRGLRTFDTSILIDGMRFRDVAATQADASSFLSDLLFTNFDRVEVLQGAGASLYGTNAIGGVINMISSHDGGPFHSDLDLQGGMLGQFTGSARIGGSGFHQKLGYSLGFGHMDVTQGVGDDNRYRNTGGSAAIDYALTPKVRIGARAFGADVYGQLNQTPTTVSGAYLPLSGRVSAIPLPTSQIFSAFGGLPYSNGPATFIPSAGDPDYYRTAQFTSTMVYLEHQVAPTFSYRAAYQALISDRNTVNGPAGPGYQPADRTADKFNGRVNTVNANAQWTPTHSDVLSVGYEWEREDFDSPAFIGQIPSLISRTEVSQRSNSAFFQNQNRWFSDRLQISLSGRWQQFSLDNPGFSGGTSPIYASAHALSPPQALTGDASAAWFFRSTNTKIRSHVGNAYRAPSLYERFGTYFDASYFSAYGDPRLRPERAISADAGIDQYFASNNLKLSASYFYTRLQQTIGFDFSGLLNPITDLYGRSEGYLNLPGGIARGVELSVEAKPFRNTLVRGSYTYTNALDRISQFGDGTLESPRLFRHKFTFSATRQFGQHWDAEFDFLGASSYLFPLSLNNPPYSTLTYSFAGPHMANLAAGYTRHFSKTDERRTVRIYTRIENLVDQDYFEDGFRTPGIVARGGVQVAF